MVSRKQHETIIEEDFPKDTQFWRLDKARQHWSLWFKFVNNYLLFRPHPKTMAQKYVIATLQTWEGKKTNWSQIVQQKMHAWIVRVKVGTP